MTLTLILFLIVLPFGLGAIFGAPYLPILRRDSQSLLDLSGIKPGQVLIDLGSGDGRLLRAAAARGATCIGYEINPYLVFISRLVCWKYRHQVTNHTANLWNTPLAPADVIYVFMIDKHMANLEKKLTNEIKRPTKVISYIFELPNKKPVRKTHNTFVYEFGTSLK